VVRELRFVADASVFADKAGAEPGRRLADRLLARTDVHILVPRAVADQLLAYDHFGTQAVRLRDCGARTEIVPDVDVASLLERRLQLGGWHFRLIQGDFDYADLQVMELALRRGMPVLTADRHLSRQVSDHPLRCERYGGVRIVLLEDLDPDDITVDLPEQDI
jgi:hypothetical protein